MYKEIMIYKKKLNQPPQANMILGLNELYIYIYEVNRIYICHIKPNSKIHDKILHIVFHNLSLHSLCS